MSLATRWFEAYQARRVVHINVNLVVAAVLSMAATSGVLAATRPWLDGAVGVAAFTAVVDGVLDVVAFAALHAWVSRRGWDRLQTQHGSLVGDTARLQMHRFVLAPLFYVVSVGGHGLLVSAGVDRIVGAWVAYMGALMLTRTLHTTYGLRHGLFDDAPSTNDSSG